MSIEEEAAIFRDRTPLTSTFWGEIWNIAVISRPSGRTYRTVVLSTKNVCSYVGIVINSVNNNNSCCSCIPRLLEGAQGVLRSTTQQPCEAKAEREWLAQAHPVSFMAWVGIWTWLSPVQPLQHTGSQYHDISDVVHSHPLTIRQRREIVPSRRGDWRVES